MDYSGSIFLTGLIVAFGLFALMLYIVSLLAPAAKPQAKVELD